ncbi:tautomerase family protein [Oceanidesulfovibrio marinus]|nr:tautomerase family protein [Oceanidesulfovibrio marinus]
MESKLSRRNFMATGAVALGAAVTWELTGIISAGGIAESEALASEGLEENTMPHISVKLFPGRSEETKQRLADAIVQDVVDIIGCEERSVTVSIEEVSSGDWKEKVYDPEIREQMDTLYKKPGYSM